MMLARMVRMQTMKRARPMASDLGPWCCSCTSTQGHLAPVAPVALEARGHTHTPARDSGLHSSSLQSATCGQGKQGGGGVVTEVRLVGRAWLLFVAGVMLFVCWSVNRSYIVPIW